MRKLLVVSVLVLVGLFITSQAHAGLLFDGIYAWAEGGTRVFDKTIPGNIKTYEVGDPTGPDLIQIWQKDFLMEGDVEYSGMTRFTWDVKNDLFSPIYSFFVCANGIEPELIESVQEGWDFEFLYGGYLFWTDDEEYAVQPYLANLAHFQLIVDTSFANSLAQAAIDYFDENEQRVIRGFDDYWMASGPGVPEPSSMLMLGIGLAGLAARKKVRA